MVQGLTLTETNYNAAVTVLQERFGDQQAIISTNMNELLKLKDSTVDRFSSLRNLNDCVTNHGRVLHNSYTGIMWTL